MVHHFRSSLWTQVNCWWAVSMGKPTYPTSWAAHTDLSNIPKQQNVRV